MAKITGPLYSLTAAGAFASSVIFQHGRGGQIAKRHHQGNQAKTSARLAQQARYRTAVDEWRALDEPGRAEFEPDAARYRITRYQAFMRQALAAPAQPAGSVWDDGATTWDGGDSVWDV